MTVGSGTLVAKFLTKEGLLNAATRSSAKATGSPISPRPNPFLPRLNSETGRWAPPRYSLRRQADLIKDAKAINKLHKLPPGLKNPLKPVELTVRPASPSVIVTRLNAARMIQPIGTTKKVSPRQEVKLKEQWVGEPKERTSFGLYGKRRLMFKGHKWQKRTKLRREAMEKVVSQVKTQKRNMRYGRLKKSKLPRGKYPI